MLLFCMVYIKHQCITKAGTKFSNRGKDSSRSQYNYQFALGKEVEMHDHYYKNAYSV